MNFHFLRSIFNYFVARVGKEIVWKNHGQLQCVCVRRNSLLFPAIFNDRDPNLAFRNRQFMNFNLFFTSKSSQMHSIV